MCISTRVDVEFGNARCQRLRRSRRSRQGLHHEGVGRATGCLQITRYHDEQSMNLFPCFCYLKLVCTAPARSSACTYLCRRVLHCKEQVKKDNCSCKHEVPSHATATARGQSNLSAYTSVEHTYAYQGQTRHGPAHWSPQPLLYLSRSQVSAAAAEAPSA